jgi:RNA polymerase sigma-70 factor (ECF subfamily)
MCENSNNLSNAQDDVLVMRAKDGDQDAFGTLFLRYKEKVYLCLTRLLYNDEIVKDLFHDTYLKAWRHIESLNEPLRFKSWLITIARNLAIDWLRQNPRGWMIPLEEIEGVSNPIDKNSNPQIVIEIDYVRCVLAEMEPALRSVLVLTATGHSPTEIAQQLGYKEGTVITYQAKARKQFRQLYSSLVDCTDETRKEK